ncbi:hypothetical protein DW747_11005 [Coprococcus catus]|uniref:Transposase n=1 Tax=Coprococcus catus TaxID=116085 RepID=A0A3E2XLR7_9FIRM|nr:hypothetical protein [Coprococcus catus]RGC45873.1 hypothetical protein DW747_11005 [Coprococcus catus]
MRKIQLYKNTGRGIYIGAIDAITKAYIRKNEVFADAFNYFMYDGAQVIQPERLKELDSTEIAILLNEKDATDKKAVQVEAQQKYRDILKLAAFISNNPRMNMEAAAARVIEAINHVPIRIQEGDGKFNMCEAIEEMIKDGREAGREVGRQEGQNRINQLIILLSKENRGEDIIKAAKDREYQEQLFKEFNL